MSSQITTSRVTNRKHQLQSFYQLDMWWMFCPGSSYSMPWRLSYLLRFSLLNHLRANKIYLHWACSGFETESPVHIRVWTWNTGNNIISNFEVISDEYAVPIRTRYNFLPTWWKYRRPPFLRIANHPDRLGPSSKFVGNSKKLRFCN